jgi:hypothetical protein
MGAQELGLGVNAAKHELDALKGRADALRAARLAKKGDAAQVGRAGAGGACNPLPAASFLCVHDSLRVCKLLLSSKLLKITPHM